MIEITSVENLKKGDIILIDAGDKLQIVTVEKIDDGLIIPVEWGGMDYCAESPDEIIRLGTKKETPTIVIRAKKIYLGLSQFWENKFQK